MRGCHACKYLIFMKNVDPKGLKLANEYQRVTTCF
jgi:hypothetical protein